jgi:predicted DNA-binding WGR domain protein
MGIIILHNVDAARNRRRYYALTWGPALVGGWAVERQWGPLDSPRRQQTVNLVGDEAKALTLVVRHLRRRLHHGYRPVFLHQAEAALAATADLAS